MCLDTCWHAGGGLQALTAHTCMLANLMRRHDVHLTWSRTSSISHSPHALHLVWPPCMQTVHPAHARTHTNL